MYLNFKTVMAGCALFLITGCAAVSPIPPKPPATREAPVASVERPAPRPPADWKPVPVPPRHEPSPRALAAMTLTNQAVAFLEKNRPDDAIRTLERAVNLHPQNGKNYYYLAEAWLMKGNKAQASEFNHLAGIYLKNDLEWMKRVKGQKRRIH